DTGSEHARRPRIRGRRQRRDHYTRLAHHRLLRDRRIGAVPSVYEELQTDRRVRSNPVDSSPRRGLRRGVREGGRTSGWILGAVGQPQFGQESLGSIAGLRVGGWAEYVGSEVVAGDASGGFDYEDVARRDLQPTGDPL